eukprot:g67873.t1
MFRTVTPSHAALAVPGLPCNLRVQQRELLLLCVEPRIGRPELICLEEKKKRASVQKKSRSADMPPKKKAAKRGKDEDVGDTSNATAAETSPESPSKSTRSQASAQTGAETSPKSPSKSTRSQTAADSPTRRTRSQQTQDPTEVKVDASNQGDKDALKSETGDAECAAFLESAEVQAYLQKQDPNMQDTVKNAVGIYFLAQKHPGGLSSFAIDRARWVGQFMACPILVFDTKVFAPQEQLQRILRQGDDELQHGGVEDTVGRGAILTLVNFISSQLASAAQRRGARVSGTAQDLADAPPPPPAPSASQPAGSGPAQAQRSLEDMREILGEDEDDTAAVPDDKEGESAGEEEVEEENTVYVTEVAPGNEYVEQVMALCAAHMEAEKKPTPLTIQMNLRVSFKELLDSHVKVFADREMTKSLPIQRLETSLAITAKALRNFSQSKMFSKMPVTEPWGKEKKTSFQAVKESMPVIKYDELDPQPAKLDIAGLIFSHHKGIPGMYQFRRQMDRNIAKAADDEEDEESEPQSRKRKKVSKGKDEEESGEEESGDERKNSGKRPPPPKKKQKVMLVGFQRSSCKEGKQPETSDEEDDEEEDEEDYVPPGKKEKTAIAKEGGKKSKAQQKSKQKGAGKGTGKGKKKKDAPEIIEFKRDLLVVSARWVKEHSDPARENVSLRARKPRLLDCGFFSLVRIPGASGLGVAVVPKHPNWCDCVWTSSQKRTLGYTYVLAINEGGVSLVVPQYMRHEIVSQCQKNLEAGHEALKKSGGFLLQHSDLPNCEFVVFGNSKSTYKVYVQSLQDIFCGQPLTVFYSRSYRGWFLERYVHKLDRLQWATLTPLL